jgi:hypothetical protein
VWLAVSVVVVLAFAAVVIGGSRSTRHPAASGAGDAESGIDATPKYRVVELRDLGFALELPPNWSSSPDDPGLASVYFAARRPHSRGSACTAATPT